MKLLGIALRGAWWAIVASVLARLISLASRLFIYVMSRVRELDDVFAAERERREHNAKNENPVD